MHRYLARWSAALIAVCALGYAPSAPAQRALPEAPASKPLWPHLASDIAPDPAVKFGVLPNGMRYALLQNKQPPNTLSIRFSFRFGSLNEAENEQGLAHFIEHMAFNGSTNVPEGEMIHILERLGLAFGADTNASTSQKFTTYMLELPNASDKLVNESLFLLRETASELTFDAQAVDRERGVVIAEWRRGDNFTRRRSEQQLDFVTPGAYAASRMPIGKREVLETAPRERLVSLYERYYRPERATMVIVGDFDVAAMESKIERQFGDWVGKGAPGTDPDLTYAIPERPSAASVFTHEDGDDTLFVYALSPYVEEPDTVAQRRADSLLSIALSAVSRRLEPLLDLEQPPFRSAGLQYGDLLESARYAAGSLSLTPDSWKPGLQTLEQAWRRALLYGFTKEEIALELSSSRTAQENAARREATRTNATLISGLLGALQNDAVFATPTSSLARFERLAAEVTPELVHAEFKRRMTPSRPLFFMNSTVARPGVEAEIVAAWDESAQVAVQPPDEKAALTFAYTDFGSPGQVVSDTRLEDIDARLVVFDNNVRLNLKKTPFQRNAVQVSVRVGNGGLDLPQAPFGFASLMSAFSDGGLEKHSAADLRTILASRQVAPVFGLSATAFGASYATTPADLLLQLQVSAAFVTSPGLRSEAERRWRQNVQLSWPRLDANANAVWSAKGLRLLASGDKRFGTDQGDGETARTFAELKEVIAPRLAQGAIEIAIVGDIDEAATIDAIAKTFGALPAREPLQTKFKSDVPVQFRTDKAPIVLTHAGEANQALAYLYWPVALDPDVDPQGARVISALAAVMRLKVLQEVREALGATYSPSAGSSLSLIYPGFGFISAGAEIKPEDVDTVLDTLLAIAAQLRAGEISDDEFSRAIRPTLEILPQNASSNSYWLGLISQAQSRPDLLERNKLSAIEAAIRKVSKADLIAAARRWLTDEAAQEAQVLPASKVGS